MADYLFNFRCEQGVPLFNSFIGGEPINSGCEHLA